MTLPVSIQLHVDTLVESFGIILFDYYKVSKPKMRLIEVQKDSYLLSIIVTYHVNHVFHAGKTKFSFDEIRRFCDDNSIQISFRKKGLLELAKYTPFVENVKHGKYILKPLPLKREEKKYSSTFDSRFLVFRQAISELEVIPKINRIG